MAQFKQASTCLSNIALNLDRVSASQGYAERLFVEQPGPHRRGDLRGVRQRRRMRRVSPSLRRRRCGGSVLAGHDPQLERQPVGFAVHRIPAGPRQRRVGPASLGLPERHQLVAKMLQPIERVRGGAQRRGVPRSEASLVPTLSRALLIKSPTLCPGSRRPVIATKAARASASPS